MTPEETDFERKPAQKEFLVTRKAAQGLLGEGGPLRTSEMK